MLPRWRSVHLCADLVLALHIAGTTGGVLQSSPYDSVPKNKVIIPAVRYQNKATEHNLISEKYSLLNDDNNQRLYRQKEKEDPQVDEVVSGSVSGSTKGNRSCKNHQQERKWSSRQWVTNVTIHSPNKTILRY